MSEPTEEDLKAARELVERRGIVGDPEWLIPILARFRAQAREAAEKAAHAGCDCGPEGHQYSDCPAYIAGREAAESLVVIEKQQHTITKHCYDDVSQRLRDAEKERDEVWADRERLRESWNADHDLISRERDFQITRAEEAKARADRVLARTEPPKEPKA